jgi:hypothetical protein
VELQEAGELLDEVRRSAGLLVVREGGVRLHDVGQLVSEVVLITTE